MERLKSAVEAELAPVIAILDPPKAQAAPELVPSRAGELAPIRECFPPDAPITDEGLAQIDQRNVAKLGPDYSRLLFVDFIRGKTEVKARKGRPFKTGILFAVDGRSLIDDFHLAYSQLVEAASEAQAEQRRQLDRAAFAAAASSSSTFGEYCARYGIPVPSLDDPKRDQLEDRWLQGLAPEVL
jgi:hypothetical protein